MLASWRTMRPLSHSLPKPCFWLALFAWNLILLQAGNLELNPGPRAVRGVSYPYTVCSREVKWGANALQCENCDTWMHAVGLDLADCTYTELGQSDNLWFCPDCGLPNHSDLNNDMYLVPVHNPFEALECNITLEDLTKLDSTLSDYLDSDTCLLIPQSASTPVRCSDVQQPSRKARKLFRSTPKIVNINCQSIMAHRDHIGVLTDSLSPNIILGTETWLDPSVTTPAELSACNVE